MICLLTSDHHHHHHPVYILSDNLLAFQALCTDFFGSCTVITKHMVGFFDGLLLTVGANTSYHALALTYPGQGIDPSKVVVVINSPSFYSSQRLVFSVFLSPKDNVGTSLTQSVDWQSVDLLCLFGILVWLPSCCVLVSLTLFAIVAFAIAGFFLVAGHIKHSRAQRERETKRDRVQVYQATKFYYYCRMTISFSKSEKISMPASNESINNVNCDASKFGS